MTAWVRFLNKTEYSVIYINLDEDFRHILLYKDVMSNYIYSPAGSIRIKIYNKSVLVKDFLYSIIPGRLNTIILY